MKTTRQQRRAQERQNKKTKVSVMVNPGKIPFTQSALPIRKAAYIDYGHYCNHKFDPILMENDDINPTEITMFVGQCTRVYANAAQGIEVVTIANSAVVDSYIVPFHKLEKLSNC